MSLLHKILAIDFGTSKTVVVDELGNIIYNEPSVVAIDNITNKVIAIGLEALQTVGKTPENITVAYPIREGVVSSPKVAAAVLSYIIMKISRKRRLFKPDLIISIPIGITSVEKRAMYEAGISAGARDVFLIPSLLCAAHGVDMDIQAPFGNTILSVGAGITEIGVMSLNGLVLSDSSRIAGSNITESIISFVKKKYQLLISFGMAEAIKTNIAAAIKADEQRELEVRGRDAATNMPKNITIHTNDISDAIKPVLMNIIVMVRQLMERTPPELSSDMVDAGIMVCGGTASLPNICTVFTKSIGVSFYPSDEPSMVVSNGLKKIIKEPGLYSIYK